MAGFIILLVLAVFGLAPAAFSLWLSLRVESLHWLHGAAFLPGIFALIYIRRITIQGNRLSIFWIYFGFLFGSMAALCGLFAWAHLVLSACYQILWTRPANRFHLPGWTFPAAFFLLLHQGYLLLSIVYDTAAACISEIERSGPSPKKSYGLPLKLGPAENQMLGGLLGKHLDFSMAHDARFQVFGSNAVIGIALLLNGEAKDLKLLFRLAELRFQLGDTRALRTFTAIWQNIYFRLSLRELSFTPFTPWFWGIWAGKNISAGLGGFVVEKALSEALLKMGGEDEQGLSRALHFQVWAGDWLLKRIWTAIENSREALRNLKKEKPTKNLFRMDVDAGYARVVPDSNEMARVTQLSPEICAKYLGDPRAQGFEGAERGGQFHQIAKKYEEIFTRRILFESLIEYRLHAAALGVDS